MHRVIETGTRHLTCTQSCQMHLIAQDGAVVAISKNHFQQKNSFTKKEKNIHYFRKQKARSTESTS